MRLLAKSPPANSAPDVWDNPPQELTLLGHLQAVQDSARAVVTSVGGQILQNAGLGSEWLPRLSRCLETAALLHDLGKANSRFQAMLRRDQVNGRQPLRHEAISVYLALHPDYFRPHLVEKHGEFETLAIAFAVLGHHIKYHTDGKRCAGESDPNAAGRTVLYTDHDDFLVCLNALGIPLGFPQRSILADELLQDEGGLYDLLDDTEDARIRMGVSSNARATAYTDAPWARFTSLLKALLVGCDVTGSALLRHGLQPSEWAKRTLDSRPSEAELGEVVRRRLGQHSLRPFQQLVAESQTRVVLAKAGCGSGKTLAAYAWAQMHASGRKLFFCYPTTGTATEGFGDYVMESGVEAALVHGRAMVDLEALLRNNHDAQAPLGEAAFLRGLESWSAKITVCTVDSVLGLLQNHRRGLAASPAIAGGAFVFDEIHAFDRRLWNSLLSFLRFFPHAPVLLMTATLGVQRLDELRALLGEELSEHGGPRELEEIKRYQIEQSGEEPAIDEVLHATSEGKRVLWISNTVDRTRHRAQELASRLGCDLNDPRILVYHSRFRYEDRVERHRALVERFASSTSELGVIGLTTQVAEMSLDLDADLLVSDEAPVASLIQRLGRLHRRARVGNTELRRALILTLDEKHLKPYSAGEIDVARSWIQQVTGIACSQADLAEAAQAGEVIDDGGVEASQALFDFVEVAAEPLREESVSGTFLLERDAIAASRSSEHAIRASIPMPLPRSSQFYTWRRVGMGWVAPQGCIDYDRLLGARWIQAAQGGTE